MAAAATDAPPQGGRDRTKDSPCGLSFAIEGQAACLPLGDAGGPAEPDPRRPLDGAWRLRRDGTRKAGSLLAAALALPGMAAAQGEPGPGPGLVAFKWLSYEDSQPGLKRVSVKSPSLLARVPVGDRHAIEGSLTADSVSGASPRYHTAISGASRMSDKRHAGDVRVTRYDERRTLSLALAGSDENDFKSRAVSVQGSWSSDDNNRSWSLGLGVTRDRISSTDNPQLDEPRRTLELALGLTQALSRLDLVQIGLTLADGKGWYSDPYKALDARPSARRQSIATLRWNHHLEAAELTLRSSYRFYRDSFGVRSHTFTIEPVWQATASWTITPLLRLYTQTAASFYYDPVYSFLGAPLPPGYLEAPPRHLSPDQRLSAFGAVTLGLRVGWQANEHWSTDIAFETYEQRGRWHVGGVGSPGLAPFSARFVQWGVARRF